MAEPESEKAALQAMVPGLKSLIRTAEQADQSGEARGRKPATAVQELASATGSVILVPLARDAALGIGTVLTGSERRPSEAENALNAGGTN